jgi:hypothetical protein
MNARRKPYDDIRVRQAISLAGSGRRHRSRQAGQRLPRRLHGPQGIRCLRRTCTGSKFTTGPASKNRSSRGRSVDAAGAQARRGPTSSRWRVRQDSQQDHQPQLTLADTAATAGVLQRDFDIDLDVSINID